MISANIIRNGSAMKEKKEHIDYSRESATMSDTEKAIERALVQGSEEKE